MLVVQRSQYVDLISFLNVKFLITKMTYTRSSWVGSLLQELSTNAPQPQGKARVN